MKASARMHEHFDDYFKSKSKYKYNELRVNVDTRIKLV